jgi:hypothetical protein
MRNPNVEEDNSQLCGDFPVYLIVRLNAILRHVSPKAWVTAAEKL